MTSSPVPNATEQLKEIKKNAGIICEAMEATAQAVLPLKERGITKRQLEVRVGQIWGYTRNNKDSLSSENHCNQVMALLQDAVTDVQLRLEASLTEIEEEREKAKVLRKTLATARKENETYAATVKRMERESVKMLLDLAEAEKCMQEFAKQAIMEAT